LYTCAPDDDIHMALQTLKEATVRRLPVVSQDGKLFGVLSMDDILLHAEPSSRGKEAELSNDEVVRTFRSITQRRVPDIVTTRTASA
jgi:CBS domain-containing protein